MTPVKRVLIICQRKNTSKINGNLKSCLTI